MPRSSHVNRLELVHAELCAATVAHELPIGHPSFVTIIPENATVSRPGIAGGPNRERMGA